MTVASQDDDFCSISFYIYLFSEPSVVFIYRHSFFVKASLVKAESSVYQWVQE